MRKVILDNHLRYIQSDISDLYDENKELNKEIERLKNELDKTRLSELDKEYRISKSIEYIEQHTDKLKTTLVPRIDFSYKDLLDILKGVDKE